MAHLNNAGWENVSDSEHADLIIVNSCGFIESAKQESINAVLEWRKLYPGKKILLSGCLSQRYAKEMSEILPEADGFMGVEDITQIVEKAWEIIQEDITQTSNQRFDKGTEDTEKKKTREEDIILTGNRPLLSMPGSAYVKISEGCNNNCSYCAIPLIRGGLVSRSIPEIVEECSKLLSRGIKELCIIGQDIGAYGADLSEGSKLPELLQAISALKGDFWVRLLYIHPDHFPLQILDIMERDPRFLPYFDIPFQHASQKILTAMNRKGSAEKHLELLNTIRTRLPNAVLRSTFLLGFPGETDQDFDDLLLFQQEAKLDWLGCFAYSREEGTAAFSMKKRVRAKIAEERKELIEEKQIPIMEKNMERFEGQNLSVLIEEQVDEFYLGRLYCQAPDIDGAAVIVGSGAGANDNGETEGKKLQLGTLVPCKVIARRGFDLEVWV